MFEVSRASPQLSATVLTGDVLTTTFFLTYQDLAERTVAMLAYQNTSTEWSWRNMTATLSSHVLLRCNALGPAWGSSGDLDEDPILACFARKDNGTGESFDYGLSLLSLVHSPGHLEVQRGLFNSLHVIKKLKLVRLYIWIQELHVFSQSGYRSVPGR